jgi:uncharacterized membrane protein YdjX (TVP38/TMEM64 family)
MLQELLSQKDKLIGLCQESPLLLYASIVILPSFGFPVGALLILAGVVWGANWHGCVYGISAVALNIAWSYLFAAGPGRKILERLLGERWQRWSSMETKDMVRLTCLLRLTPGIPLFAQNYLLGLLRVPYLTYLTCSIPLSSLYVVGFIVTGGAIFSGKLFPILTGVGILVIATVVTRMFRSKLARHPSSH